jgi:hypothetical protein
MQRRDSLLSLLGLSLSTGPLYSDQELAVLPTPAELAADARPRFFTPAEFSSFTQLGNLLIPAYDGRPGALEAKAPEFLDFLLSQSPAAIQNQYRQGLAQFAARGLEGAFSRADAYAKFLTTAKLAFYRATVNSREYAAAMSERSRSAAGLGNYWLPLG